MKYSHKFAIDTSWVFLSSLFYVLFQFLRKPIMARYLGPEGLGLYSLVIIIISVVELIATLGVPQAIVKYIPTVDKNTDETDILMSTSFLIMLISGGFSTFALYVSSDYIGEIFNSPISLLLKLYSLVFPFSLLYTITLFYLNGKRKMKTYSMVENIKTFMSFSFVVLFVISGYGVIGAIVGNIIAVILGCFIILYIIRKDINLKIIKLKSTAYKLTSLGSKIILSNIIYVINYQTDLLFIGFFLSTSDVGFYSVSVALSQFFWIIPQSIQKITYPSTAELWSNQDKENLGKMLNISFKFSAILLLTLGISLWFFAENILIYIFGAEYANSVGTFKILIIGTVIYGSLKSINSTLTGIGHPEVELNINIFGFLMNIVFDILLIPNYGIKGAAFATVCSFIVITILNLYYINKKAKIKMKLKWCPSVITCTSIVMYLSIKYSFVGQYTLIKCCIITLYIVYLIYCIPDKSERNTIIELINNKRNIKRLY